ncbi:hypothetical protein [Sedimentitalea todarodis]|uniref:Uncharacterized protein n=1 Tax=Sedimentitalea todarodis TaxID=1631240 RepID=A0ABU3VKZ9_9RHOB|nr:hypothetical protein [Sedimentitalea todarodis]MDU9006859.1 hypothetical protein [Sedimentitalea todarodis]
MTTYRCKTLTVAGLVMHLCSPASAQDRPTEEILSEAQGVLHLTCNTLFETYGNNEDAMLDVIGLMVAVSLNNRGIDFTTLDLTPQEKDEIQAEFADQIGDICAEDADALMAGIVDHTVADLVTYY